MKKLLFLLILLAGMSQAQTTVAPFLTSNPQFFTTSGLPNSGGCVFTYAAGTTTPLATYSESTGTSLNSNPVPLNSAGFATSGGIWLTSATYKFVVKTAGGTNCSTGSTITTSDGITWSTPLATFAGLIATGDLTLQQSTAATSGANQSSNNLKIQGNYWTGVVSANDTWTLQDILGTGSNPTSTLTLTHSGSSGAATFSVPGNQTVGGTLGVTGATTTATLNSQCIIDGTVHAATAAGVNACDAALGSGTGEIIVPSNVTSLTGTNIVLSKHHYLIVQGNGTITTSPIRVPDSTTDSSADSGIWCPDHAKLLLAPSTVTDAYIEDVNFNTLTGSANAHGTFKFTLRGCRIDGNKNNQAALVTTGTGSISTVARNASGVVTLVFSNTPSPAFVAGMTVAVGGQGAAANLVTNDGWSFNGRYIVQSATSNSITYNDKLCLGGTCSIIATTAATGTTPIAVGYSGSAGVRLYGLAHDIENNVIANNVLDGFWSEGNDATFSDDSTSGTCSFIGNHHINSGGDGFVFWGPQVSHEVDNEIYGHGQWGSEIFSSIQTNANVSFNNTSGSRHVGFSAAVQETSSQETSGTGWGVLVDNGTNGYQTFSSMVNSAGTGIGLETRSSAVLFDGVIVNSATGWKNTATSSFDHINAHFASNTVSAIDVSASGGSNTVVATITVPALATDVTGTPASSDEWYSFATGAVNRVLRKSQDLAVLDAASNNFTGATGIGYAPAASLFPRGISTVDWYLGQYNAGAGNTIDFAAGAGFPFRFGKFVSSTFTPLYTIDPINGTTEASANGATWQHGQASELLTLSTSGTTTDTSANLLPANSIIEAVVARVTTTITVATDWKLGDGTQAARFSNANSTMTAGTTQVGLNQADPTVASSNLGPVQASAAKVRVTTTGTPGAGVIRITVFYRQFVPPTS